MQPCKDQLRNKHVPFHKKKPAVKRLLLPQDTETIEKGHYSKPVSFHFFMKELHFSKDYVAYYRVPYLKRGERRKATCSRNTKKLEKFQKPKKTRKPFKPKKQ